MRHKYHFENGVEADVTVNVELPTDEIENIVDKIVDGAVTVICVATAASLIWKWL